MFHETESHGSKGPCISAKEPCIPAKEPRTSAKESYISTKEPNFPRGKSPTSPQKNPISPQKNNILSKEACCFKLLQKSPAICISAKEPHIPATESIVQEMI